jgi:hypothetical protein
MTLQRYTINHDEEYPDNNGEHVRWKDFEEQQEVFAAVINVINQFANGEAAVDVDEEEQSEVARVFQLAIINVQQAQDRLASKRMLEKVMEIRESKDR